MNVHPNIKAFAYTLWNSEGTYNAANPGIMYRTMYGGGTFTDMSKHPNKKVLKWGKTSTAAGAYQFLIKTWLAMQVKLNLPDFSPKSQDLAFVQKLKDIGVYDKIVAGNLEGALQRARHEWSSLPGGKHPAKTIAQVKQLFTSGGGSIA